MKNTELRIGNLIQGAQGLLEVEEILKDGNVKVKGVDSIFKIDSKTPCLLPAKPTHEALINLGFEKSTVENEDLYKTGVYSYFPSYGIFCFSSENGEEGSTISMCVKYVHQLQNLYFSITGKELTLIPS